MTRNIRGCDRTVARATTNSCDSSEEAGLVRLTQIPLGSLLPIGVYALAIGLGFSAGVALSIVTGVIIFHRTIWICFPKWANSLEHGPGVEIERHRVWQEFEDRVHFHELLRRSDLSVEIREELRQEYEARRRAF